MKKKNKNRINKKSIGVLIGLIFILSSFYFSSYAKSWGNGTDKIKTFTIVINEVLSKDSKYYNKDPISVYKQFYEKSDTQFFGTHDFLALLALDALIESSYADPTKNPQSYLWLKNTDAGKDFLYYYLVGTEYLDGKEIKIKLDGEEITPPRHLGHSVYFNDDGTINGKSDYLDVVKDYVEDLKGFLSEESAKCQTAAFYLGIMTHVIADLSCVPHVLKTNDEFHYWIEKTVTRQNNLEHYTNNGNNIVFNIDIAKYLGLWVFPDAIEPHILAELMGRTTYFNLEVCPKYIGTGSYNAKWILQEFNEDDRKMKTIWNYNNPIHENPEYHPEFLNRLNQLLNWAVFYIASALAYALEDFDGICPQCEEGKDEDSDKQKRDTPYGLDAADYLARYAAGAAAVIMVILVGSRKLKLGG